MKQNMIMCNSNLFCLHLFAVYSLVEVKALCPSNIGKTKQANKKKVKGKENFLITGSVSVKLDAIDWTVAYQIHMLNVGVPMS